MLQFIGNRVKYTMKNVNLLIMKVGKWKMSAIIKLYEPLLSPKTLRLQYIGKNIYSVLDCVFLLLTVVDSKVKV